MTNEEYQEYRTQWFEYPEKCHVSRFPLHLDIELTNRCNLHCSMCMFHSKNAPFKPDEDIDIDFELYKKLIDEGSKKELKAIKLNYRGEPLLYEQLPEAIQYAKKNGILDVQLNTNALLLTKEMSKKIICAGLDLLIVSDYDIITQLKNVIYLHDLRDVHNRETPKIRVQTERPERWDGIVDEKVEPIYYDYHHIKEVFDKSEFKCSFPWQRFLVLADGMVMSCSCGTTYKEKELGSAWSLDLEDYWIFPEMRFLRFCHCNRNSSLISICRKCPLRNDWIRRHS